MSKGFIYIFTNPSFKEYVKIGFATNVQQRLNDLNRSTAIPFAFRCYATYEVDSVLSDKKLHNILDKLDPDLRSREVVKGKERVREFYEMSAEDAYSILEAIAEINDYTDRLKKWKETEDEKKEEKISAESKEMHREKAAPFAFSMAKIPVGAKIEFWPTSSKGSGIFAVVTDDRHVEYEGTTYTLTGLVKKIIGNSAAHIPGPKYFKYKGQWLNDLRKKCGN